MKRNRIVLFSFAILMLLLSACTRPENKTIKIAVMGNPDTFYPCFQEGIRRAVGELNDEYADSGYSVECVFVGGDSYEDSVALIDTLAADPSVTAMIGAVEMDVNQTAAEVCERSQKLMVVPYVLNDSVYTANHYTMVFSMANSGRYIGQTLRIAARESGKTRWVLCAENREFELEEVRGFLQSGGEDGIRVVDCVNITTLQNHFDETCTRWETLGVEGVILFPEGSEGFELLKKLKSRNPDWIFGGDSAFDDSTLICTDAELAEAMTDFILVPEFSDDEDQMSQEQMDHVIALEREYYERTGSDIDTWFFQGYNAVRMICDTAVQNQVTDPVKIAQLLHQDGYCGLLSPLNFDDDGQLIVDTYYYVVFVGDEIPDDLG